MVVWKLKKVYFSRAWESDKWKGRSQKKGSESIAAEYRPVPDDYDQHHAAATASSIDGFNGSIIGF